jgi:alpha-1,2-mannosyltransferase
VVGRVRAAIVAATVLGASIAVGWLSLGTESRSFWRHLGPDVTTIGPVTAPDHWSINGTIWRVAGDGGNDALWFALGSATMLATLVLARSWWRGGSRVGAIGLIGLGSVLASPFSWSHHWIAVTPLFVALLSQAHRARRPRVVLGAVATSYALTVTGVWWHAPRRVLELVMADSRADALALNTYLLVAGILLALAVRLRPSIDVVDPKTSLSTPRSSSVATADPVGISQL